MPTLAQEHTSEAGFAAALRTAVEQARAASGADIVALYPYDEDLDSFYSPVSLGLPEHDIVKALPDLADQLRRFRADQSEGKTPEDFSPVSYGPAAWLLTMRRPLISADAGHEVDSSFVRRHQIQAIVGLPLMVGSRVVGLLYLNYVKRENEREQLDVNDAAYQEEMRQAAGNAALALDSARRLEQDKTLQALSDLVGTLSALPSELVNEGSATVHLETALQRILSAANLGAAALYAPDPGGVRLMLLAAYGCPALAAEAITPARSSIESLDQDEAIVAALRADGLTPQVALSSRGQVQQAILLLADRDPLALKRQLPSAHMLLQAAADLLGAMVSHGVLIDALGGSNRTLGAVTRLGTRLLQPGVTQEQVLETAVLALTDSSLPELDFEFAAFFLLETAEDGRLMVARSAGASASPAIDLLKDTDQSAQPASDRTPRWVTPQGVRVLEPRDIVGYVATRRRAVVVEALEAADEHFLIGYPEDLLERLEVKIAQHDGRSEGTVRAARLREAADRAPLRAAGDEGISYRPTEEFTLDAELFNQHGHASLVRVFMPFGPIRTEAGSKRATGVLEAGYHVSRRQRMERVQIEALRACAATLAAAVETARLYEDVSERATQLEIVTEVSRTIATSIDLEQTLGLVARNMARSVDASVCLIALLEDDGSSWYGAAASDKEDVWRQRRMERPERSIIFEVADRGRPMVVEDAQNHELISPYMARLLDIRSLVALPLMAGDEAIGAVVLGERTQRRVFTNEEVERASGIAGQAAMAIRNARVHSREEEEQHVQKDVVLIGFGQWGRRAYKHLLLLKNFFNFRIHVVDSDLPGRRELLAETEQDVLANGDLFYWDSPANPAREVLAVELEPSCYVITYIATPAETHLPVLKSYYELSNVVLIEKPLGAPPEEYRDFLDRTDGSVEIVAADHYWFKMEVRLLQLLLTEERNLRAFLDDIEEVEVEILEEQAPGGSGAQIGMIADLIPHAFAILSLLTPLDRIELTSHRPLRIGRYEPLSSEHETYARLEGTFDHRGRRVRVTVHVGKGVTNAKWIKLSGERRMGGRRPFYKFDFARGEVIDGTQSALRAATRPVRQPGVPDNAHLSMLRHVIEKKHPAVGILSIREALRANARIQELERMASDLLVAGEWTSYSQGQRPAFPEDEALQLPTARESVASRHQP